MLLKIGIAARELMLTEPAATIGTQWRGMDTLKHQIAGLVNHISLTSGITSPKHIHQMFTMSGQSLNSRISKPLPPQRRVTIGLMGTDCQRGVEQQYTLFSPSCQVTRSRNRRTQVGLNFFEDIL